MDDRYLKEYYENHDEDIRLTTHNHGKIQFLTTKRYVEKYLSKNYRILEVGAGTGVYSLHFAEMGYQVDAIELVQRNIDILQSKMKSNMNLSVRQGNAIDLSDYEDNTFDITLVLGPMYHLFSEEDKHNAISEAIRVTKDNEYLFFAYCTHDGSFIRNALMKGNLMYLVEQGLLDSKYHCLSNPELLFNMYHVADFDKMMSSYPITHLHSVATDGIAHHVADYIDKLNNEEFSEWLKYHFSTCERSDLIGYSNHVLYIAKKA